MLISTLQSAGLTGRGGAAFPTHRKLTAVANQKGTPVVVGNGAEGEPASDKDKTLLWSCPHLVLDGLQLAAEAVGAGACAIGAFDDDRVDELLGLKGKDQFAIYLAAVGKKAPA